MITPVILCGGSGTRLWPLSRELYPKQFLPLVGDKSMLRETVCRIAGLPGVSQPVVLCNVEHRFLTAEQLRSECSLPQAIILEPVGRNTAPAIAVAALHQLEMGEDPLLLVLPADHLIRNVEAFAQAVTKAEAVAETGWLTTFGIVPTGPETGYGYIQVGESLGSGEDGARAVQAFVEKPDLERARQFVDSGEYLWNSGMFLFKASRYVEELERFAPEMLACCRKALADARRDLDFLRLDEETFKGCPSDSVDYAVMEKAERTAVVPLDAGWSDIGSFTALHEAGELDAAGTRTVGDVLHVDVQGSYLHSQHRLVAAIGLKDVVLIETSDAVMVASRDRVQEVKELVNRLRADGRQEIVHHSRVYRPWGSYESVDVSDRFQVKRITVKPGSVLSLQKHHHRSEHWIVVSGTAEITRDDETFILTEDQSTYIPLGAVHRLRNPGKIPLELIEVQTGTYLGEDDIVRLEDLYGRQAAKS